MSDHTELAQNAATDPVCGMAVNVTTRHQINYEGTTYYFCCAHCVERFGAEPKKFLSRPTTQGTAKPHGLDLKAASVSIATTNAPAVTASQEKDPVCGMEVQPNQAAPKSEQGGQTYYFCSTSCKQKFDQNPKQYASQQKTQKSK